MIQIRLRPRQSGKTTEMKQEIIAYLRIPNYHIGFMAHTDHEGCKIMSDICKHFNMEYVEKFTLPNGAVLQQFRTDDQFCGRMLDRVYIERRNHVCMDVIHASVMYKKGIVVLYATKIKEMILS